MSWLTCERRTRPGAQIPASNKHVQQAGLLVLCGRLARCTVFNGGGVRVAGLRGTLRGAGSGFFLSVISFSRVSSRSRRSVFLPPRPRHTDNRHRQTRPTSSCGSIAVILASPPASGSAHAARTFLRSRNPTGDGPSRTSLGASARGRRRRRARAAARRAAPSFFGRAATCQHSQNSYKQKVHLRI